MSDPGFKLSVDLGLKTFVYEVRDLSVRLLPECGRTRSFPPSGGRMPHYNSSARCGLGTRVGGSYRDRLHEIRAPGPALGSTRSCPSSASWKDWARPLLRSRPGHANMPGLFDRPQNRNDAGLCDNPGHRWRAGNSGPGHRAIPSRWDGRSSSFCSRGRIVDPDYM